MPVCPYCENSIEAGAATCPYCGRSLRGAPVAATPGSPVPPAPPGWEPPPPDTTTTTTTVRQQMTVPPDVVEEVRRLAADGDKIEAIRVLREATGASLAVAKQVVDAMASGQSGTWLETGKTQIDPAVVAEVRDLLIRGRRIEAIKRLREATGLDLKEAVAVADAMGGRRPGTGSGCSTAVVGLLVVVALLLLGLAATAVLG